MTEINQYYIGQIFENEYPPNAAVWCNEQGNCYIKEISSEEKEGSLIRKFQIAEIPPKTEIELLNERIGILKEQLQEIDLKSIRAIRANDIEYIQQYETEALVLRTELQSLSTELEYKNDIIE